MKAIVPLAEGFEEIEAITIIDVLRRAGIKVDIVGIEDEIVVGRNGIKILCEKTLNEIEQIDYDLIVLPGGNPGYKNLMNSEILLNIIRNMNSKGRIIGAICASPLVLLKAGILKDKKATCYPTLKNEIPNYEDKKVVVDGNIITSQGPATAIEFSLEIVKILKPEIYEQIRKDLLSDRYG
ncbi:MAG: DJ-1/PfpI family protein [Candidatus Aenigmatarchaeota archaeon]